MVRWVVGSILHGGPIELFLVPAKNSTTGVKKVVVCVILFGGMMHIKEPLLLTGKSSPYGGSGFPLSLSGWSLTPYNRK